jgi:hypothetical protein
MPVTTTTALVLGGAVVVLLLLVVLFATSRRRDRATEPVRLGPSWTPPGSSSAPRVDPQDDERVPLLVERTGLGPVEVATSLVAWDEYLAVLGLLELPPGHRWLVYDPYDPPVAERRDGRAVPDRTRVARDTSMRTGVAESAVLRTLDALAADDSEEHEHADGRAGQRE